MGSVEFAEAEAEFGEAFLDFEEGGLAEVFDAEEFGFGACGEFADAGDAEALEGLA